MRSIINFLLFLTVATLFFAGCEKTNDLPYYKLGNPVNLTSSVTSVAPATADSNKTVLTLNWTFPNYATDSGNMKYIVEMDSTGKNFAKETTRTVTKSLSTSFLAKELNNMLLGYGYAFNVPVTMDVRVTSSYANNNERYVSNVIKIQMTPYKVPPKVAPPSSNTLFIVGNATAGGWGNPVPVPAQQFTRLDSVTYQGTFYLNGGAEYLLLPVNGDWSHKYAVADKSLAGLNAGGSFGADLSDNFPGPAKTGMYKITVDFQNGRFTVTQVKLYSLLYVPGDYQGWNPATAHTLGSVNSDGSYDGYVNFPAGGTYEFKFTTTPDWSNALGDGGGGTLSSSGGNLTVPGAGYYHLHANTVTNTWSATATTWSLIGSFAASNWSNDVDMTYSTADNNWKATITTVAGDQFKFRANHDWSLNYGESGGSGSLIVNGDNIGDPSKNFAVPAGTHTITLYLNNSGYYTYKIQ
jgi:starch-binding outer membrane protein SusE/F